MRMYMNEAYEDELFYSILTRYLMQISSSNFAGVMAELTGHVARPTTLLQSSLSVICRKTMMTWNRKGEELLNSFTLFPYFSRYTSAKHTALCIKKLLSNNSSGIQLKLGIVTNRIKGPRHLRFCNICSRNDIDKYGETYWHRCHQLPGVLVCPEHGDQLIDTSALMHPKGFDDYIDATNATSDFQANISKALNKSDHDKALMIARRSRDMLQRQIPGWEGEEITKIYRKEAIEHGYIEGAIQLSLAKLEKGFVAYFGHRLLRLLQCDFRIGHNGSWFRNIFRSAKKTFHPLEHALVQLFLESVTAKVTDKIPFGLGPWRCPNPYGKHDEEYPIKNPIIYIGHKHRKYVASARCSCGFHFTFQAVSESDPQMPVISKVMQYGPTWEEEAGRLRRSGLSMLAIAKKMGVRDRAIKNMLQAKRPIYRVTEQKIDQWRKEWLKLLSKVPNRSRKLAARANKGLYIRLLRNDRAWLFSEARRWSHNSKPPRYIDWASRDRLWSGMLTKAAEKIRIAVPHKRATRTAIIKEAGLGLKILAKYERYPKCKWVLDKYSESKEAYGVRRQEVRLNGNTKFAA